MTGKIRKTILLIILVTSLFFSSSVIWGFRSVSALEENAQSLETIIGDKSTETDMSEDTEAETEPKAETFTDIEDDVSDEELETVGAEMLKAPLMATAYPTNTRYLGYGKRNQYVYSVDGTNDYNYYLEYDDGSGNKERILSYCYNKTLSGPQAGSWFNLTYQNATNSQFYDSATGKWWKSYYKAVATRIIYYGYPYNKSGTDYMLKAIQEYGVSEDKAEDALRWATQNALWYWTDGAPDLPSYSGVKTGKNAMLGLAYEIYQKAYKDGYTVPDGLEMDIFYPENSSVQRMLAVHDDYVSPVPVPSVEKITVRAEKIWEDDGLESDRPGSVTFHLYGEYEEDGVLKTIDTEKTAVISGGSNLDTWTYDFTEMPKYKNGHLIKYYVKEENLSQYYTAYESGTNIINTHVPIPDNCNATINLKKELNGSIPGDMRFTFVLSDNNGPITEAVNDSSGNASFDLTFPSSDFGKTFTYYVSEKDKGVPGVTYDETEFTVTVDISPGGKTDITYGDVIIFENTYIEPAKVVIEAKKLLDGSEPGNSHFTFVLSDTEGKTLMTATNLDDGRIVFDPITYSEAGTYKYILSELDDKRPGIVFDTKNTDVTVEVTMNTSGGELDGKDVLGNYDNTIQYNDYFYMEDPDTGERFIVYCLNASKHSPDGRYYTATKDISDEAIASAMGNTGYTADESADRIKRILYYFDLYPNDYPSSYDRQLIIWQASGFNYLQSDVVNKILDRVKSVPDSFHTVFFDPRLSGYQSLIYGYSDKKTAVRYVLSGESDIPVFENTRTKGAKAQITAKKTLDGKAPGEYVFTFVLKDSEGKTVESKTNDRNGDVIFSEMVFETEGVYKYYISEVNDGQKDIHYDHNEHEIDITVTKEVGDKLVAEISGDSEIKNTTAVPVSPRMPDTGGSGVNEMFGFFILILMLFGFVYFYKIKNII